MSERDEDDIPTERDAEAYERLNYLRAGWGVW
jgi:hypothetical protein